MSSSRNWTVSSQRPNPAKISLNMPFFPEMSPLQLALIVGLAAFSGIAGGMAGYGTGALMPLVLVPLVGAKPVVPIIAISAMFTNTARVAAFRDRLDSRRALIALVCALPTCALGAWLYTLLTGHGAALVIADVPSDRLHNSVRISKCPARQSLKVLKISSMPRSRRSRLSVATARLSRPWFGLPTTATCLASSYPSATID